MKCRAPEQVFGFVTRYFQRLERRDDNLIVSKPFPYEAEVADRQRINAFPEILLAVLAGQAEKKRILSRNRRCMKCRLPDTVPLKRSLDCRTIAELKLNQIGRCRRQKFDRQLLIAGIVENGTAADLFLIEFSACGELACVSGADAGHAAVMQITPALRILEQDVEAVNVLVAGPV